MAVILILDRANVRGHKRPRVQAVVCDGYTLYSEKEGEIQGETVKVASRTRIHMPENSVKGLAISLMNSPIGSELHHEIREKLARMAAEKRAKEKEKSAI